MKIFVTGGSGYLGRRVCRAAHRAGAQTYAGYGNSPDLIDVGDPVAFDLRAPSSCAALLRDLRPDAIIHCAAINPGKDPDLMRPINLDGTRAVARIAAEIGARIVHVSTDVVHDGTAAPYADDAAPTPLGLYAETKAAAERAVLDEAADRAAIVRTSLIYDLDEIDHGTASFLRRLDENPPLRLFHDVLRQPVFAPALADALFRLAQSEVTGSLNVAGSQALTREAFGRKMLSFWGADPEDPRIESISARAEGFTVALDLRLHLDRARRLSWVRMPGVDEVMKESSYVGRRPAP